MHNFRWLWMKIDSESFNEGTDEISCKGFFVFHCNVRYFNWEWHGFLDAQHTRDLKWTSSVLVRVEVRVNRNALLPLAEWLTKPTSNSLHVQAACVSVIVCTWYKRAVRSLTRARSHGRVSERAGSLKRAQKLTLRETRRERRGERDERLSFC